MASDDPLKDHFVGLTTAPLMAFCQDRNWILEQRFWVSEGVTPSSCSPNKKMSVYAIHFIRFSKAL